MPRLRKHDPRQIDLLDWAPTPSMSATILRHPGQFRAVWKTRITPICDTLMEMPEFEARMHTWGPIRLGEQLAAMGATELEVAREVDLYRQTLAVELARRRHGGGQITSSHTHPGTAGPPLPLPLAPSRSQGRSLRLRP